jgi:CO/xanthine dehydrogenase Mo-binding subunit
MFKRIHSGTSTTYVDGVEKVTGHCKYTFDLHLPGMLVGKFLYPEYPHARLTRLDTAAAEALPGVAAVVTHRDLPGEKLYGYVVKDQPAFAIDEVCYVGDIVAGVAAEDEDAAEAALQAIEVEYEPLPGVFDALEARRPESPLARLNLASNILSHQPILVGDPDRGFAQADAVVEHWYATGAIEQFFLECEGTVADWDGNVLTVYAGGQHPHRDRIQIAEQLGLPANRVRVVYPYVGGGFGGKDELHTQAQVALLAYKARRPVKLIRNREESMLTHVKRQRFFVRYKTGVKRDGTITAIEVEGVLDAGPYTNASLPVAGFAAEMASGCYNVPNARIDTYAVATNNLLGGAMRGFGGPEMAFAQEQNLDRAAAAIGMDPLEIRLKNAIHKGSVMPTGAEIYHDIALADTLRQAAAACNWENRDSWLERRPAPHLRRGLGMASIWHGMSIGRNLMDYGRATLEMAPDGSVVLQSGTADIGSGARTAQVLIAADALGVQPEAIRLAAIDTETTPDAGPTTASRSVYMIGKAILQAAEGIRKSLLEVAGEALEAAVDDLEMGQGRIAVRGAPADRFIAVKEAARKAWEASRPLRGEGHATLWQPPKPLSEYTYPVAHTIFVYATQIAQVLVDIETGQTKVEKVWAAHDVGRAINVLGALGQIHGGVMQGIGTALMEELQQEQGRLQNATIEGYLVPAITETPEIVSILVESAPNPDGPFGAVGLGEQTMNPTAAAIANAVFDAVGARTWEIPMTPERVLAALDSQ